MSKSSATAPIELTETFQPEYMEMGGESKNLRIGVSCRTRIVLNTNANGNKSWLCVSGSDK